MKKFLLIPVALLFSISSFAHQTFIDDPIVIITQQEENELNALMDQYEWLFDELMPENLANHEGAKKSFRVHLRDSVKFFPHPDDLSTKEMATSASKYLIGGNITYVGFFPKKYRYTVTKHKDSSIEFKVLIYFKNGTNEQLASMKEKIQQAEDFWNANRHDFGINYYYKFGIASEKKYAHFTPKFKKGTRGPYDTNWNPKWSSKTVAHEIGHMLGLGDEYQTLTGKVDCIPESLMCAGSTYLPFHSYHVVRRLFTKKAIKRIYKH